MIPTRRFNSRAVLLSTKLIWTFSLRRASPPAPDSGNLDEMMERIADFYDQETASWIDTAGRLIEPVLMVGIGLVIGAIVLMLYSPIFDLANAV